MGDASEPANSVNGTKPAKNEKQTKTCWPSSYSAVAKASEAEETLAPAKASETEETLTLSET